MSKPGELLCNRDQNKFWEEGDLKLRPEEDMWGKWEEGMGVGAEYSI